MNVNISKCKVDSIRTQKELWKFVQISILKVINLTIISWTMTVFCESVKSISAETNFSHKITSIFLDIYFSISKQ